MAKVGRPRIDDPKGERITIRLREQEKERLEAYASAMKMSKSGVILKGLELLLDQSDNDERANHI